MLGALLVAGTTSGGTDASRESVDATSTRDSAPRALGGVKLLILDDWGLEPLGPEQRHDMLEIVEERYGRGATLITSQIPVNCWHELIGEPTPADAILDRIIHNAHRLQLKGDALCKLLIPAMSLGHSEIMSLAVPT
jgi:DNA replication protein DnaC